VNHDEVAKLAGSYALGALDGEDLEVFERHLPDCWECRQRVQEYDEIYAEGAQVLAPVDPSPQLRSKLLGRISGTAHALPAEALPAPTPSEPPPAQTPSEPTASPPPAAAVPAGPWRQAYGWYAQAAGAILAVGVGLSGWMIADHRGQDLTRVREALQAQEEDRLQLELQLDTITRAQERTLAELSDLRGRLRRSRTTAGERGSELARIQEEIRALEADLARRDADVSLRRRLLELLAAPDARIASLTGREGAPAASGRVVWLNGEVGFLGRALPSLPADKTYELWAIVDSSPVPAGLFAVDDEGNSTGTFTLDPAPAHVDAFALTLEPAGGVDAPTGDMILVME
jgi:anti-sigma-K factor RskA